MNKGVEKKLKLAARKVRKEMDKHFEKDKWDLSFTFLNEEVFYKAFGCNLENFLLKELQKSKNNLVLKFSKGDVVVSLSKKKKSLDKKTKL